MSFIISSNTSIQLSCNCTKSHPHKDLMRITKGEFEKYIYLSNVTLSKVTRVTLSFHDYKKGLAEYENFFRGNCK